MTDREPGKSLLGGVVAETPEEEEAARELSALSEETGCCDEPLGACPFCGARLPCTAHRAGG